MNTFVAPGHKRPKITVKFFAASLSALLGLFMFGLMPSAAHAAPAGNDLGIQPYLVNGSYKGVATDIKVLAGDSSTVTDVRVTVQRSSGGDVVKVSKTTGSVVSTLQAGNSTTAPIVIQPGTYNEAGSSSWEQPLAVWTWETRPTNVTVELLDGSGAVLFTATAPVPASFGTITLDSLMPAEAVFDSLAANFHDAANYKGLSVDFRLSGVTDAKLVIVQVDRANGFSVVKLNKESGSLLGLINAGASRSYTAPIVIQPGTYDGQNSSSWMRSGAVWTSSSTPSSVTVTIVRTVGPDLTKTVAITGSDAGIMPTAATPDHFELPTDYQLDVNVPLGATDVTVKLGTPAGNAVTTPVKLTVNSLSGPNLEIPAGTTVTAGTAIWDGVITLPAIRTGVVVPAPDATTATVDLAIEVGSAGTQLELSAPVTLVLKGQAGKRAGFIEAGVLTSIMLDCSTVLAGTLTTECWMDDGADLVIMTTHFTTFVAFSGTLTSDVGTGISDLGDDEAGTTGTTTAVTGAGSALAATGVSDVTVPLGFASILVALGIGTMLLARRGRHEMAPRTRA